MESRALFSPNRAAVVESLPFPPHLPFIVMKQLGSYFEPRTVTDENYRLMTVDNWLPADNGSGIVAGSSTPDARRAARATEQP